jgi:hypothetical protein
MHGHVRHCQDLFCVDANRSPKPEQGFSTGGWGSICLLPTVVVALWHSFLKLSIQCIRIMLCDLKAAARYLVTCVEEAELPSPLSKRDGKLLKLVPQEIRMSAEDLSQHLAAAMNGENCCCDAIVSMLPIQGRHMRTPTVHACVEGERVQANRSSARKRFLCAWARSVAYLHAGHAAQAIADAAVAVAYAPNSCPTGRAVAYAQLSAAQSALKQHVDAALSAFQVRPSGTAPEKCAFEPGFSVHFASILSCSCARGASAL